MSISTQTAVPKATNTSDLVRFLLARVDDDDAELRRMARKLSRGSGPGEVIEELRSIPRLRAECAAKRQVIGSLQQLIVLRDQPCEKTVRDQAIHMLRSLAAPYAAHPAFRDAWRPTAPR